MVGTDTGSLDELEQDEVEAGIIGGAGVMLLALLLAIIGAIVGAVGVGLWVWGNAPVVGGGFWPYIRVVAAIVGAVIGAKVLGIVGYLVGVVGGGFIAVYTATFPEED